MNDRRHFLRQAAAGIGISLCAGTVTSILAGCETDESLPTVPAGSTFTFDVGAEPGLAVVGNIIETPIDGLSNPPTVFITRVDDTTFAVFSTICTHQGCPVSLPSEPGDLCVCPCHMAAYSPVDGSIVRQPLSGSATDLPKYRTSCNAETQILTITT